jgi:TolB-like protein
MSLTPGTKLGPYEIVSPLGAGGMGEVWRARDTRLGRDVAIKVLPEDVASDPRALARFESEARAAAALSHPNITALYDVGASAGIRYAVSELLEGETLRAALVRGSFPVGRALEISEQIARGLAAAHEKGLVHRDVKPENVYITHDGHAKLLDFGLARHTALFSDSGDTHSPTDVILTEKGAVIGTVAYMSPEQASGRPIDHRSDQFSLGIVLYEMLAGKRPFQGNTAAETLTAIIREEPGPLEIAAPGVPAPLRRIVSRCLAKEPIGRFGATRDLAQDLAALRLRVPEGLSAGVEPAPAPASARTAESPRRRWSPVAAAAAVVTVLAGAGVLLVPRFSSRGPAAGGSSPIRSVAVLPFENLAHEPAQDYFVDGMHDALITDLAKLGTLRVTSRSSVMRYRGQTKPMKEVAQELGVDAVIEGSVLRAGDKVRITAQLIRASTDEHVWAESYDRNLEDVLRLLSDVSRAIAVEVQTTVAREARPALPPPAATPPRVRPEAWEAYLRGRRILNEGSSSAADLRNALESFQQAVEFDPGFALGWSGFATANFVLAFFRQAPVEEVLPRAREATLKAIALDDSSGDAYGVLGSIELYFDWNFDSARRHLERGVALSPHSLLTRHAWADYLMVTGRLEESLEQVKLGRSYEPISPLAQVMVLFHTLMTHRYDEVIAEARRTLAAFPDLRMVRGILADALWRTGRYEEALDEARIQMGADSEGVRLWEAGFRKGGPKAGLKAYADYWATRFAPGRGYPLGIAGIYAEAGERELAFQWLEKALADRTPQLLHVVGDPAFDGLRDDPRYKDLIRRIGIPLSRSAS